MKRHSTAVLAALSCMAAVGLAACAGGLSTTSTPGGNTVQSGSPATSPAPAASSTAGTSGSGSSGSSVAGSTVSVNAPIATFPIPAGSSTVLNDVEGNGDIEIEIEGVPASTVSSFYAGALPAAGYTITENNEAAGAGGGAFTGVGIEFTGHGYSGQIGALSGVGIIGSPVTVGNVTGIDLTPQ
jgi:hypothetical protein